ncbi:MAG: AAA family ATPase [Ignavibacteriales bacterium]|nr:AAA family ATPase [Ignavibacteriales bacterium]
MEIVSSPKPGSPRINVNFTPNYEQDSFNRFLNGEEIRDVIFKAVDKIFTNFRENNLAQYFIPAVRSGYYLGTSSFTNTLAQINQFRSELTSDTFKMPKVTVPVSDFILQLSGLSNSANSSAPGYIEIIREMESNLLEGAVIFNPDEGKLFYKSSVFDSSYDLSVVSSMVAEISLIAGYFKFVVNDTILEKSPFGSVNAFKQHPLIFIEEPEAHLHPEVQVKLMEYFVKLANLGVKIIITTHSDYMLGKLSNILIANEIDPEKVGSYLLKMGEKGSVGDSQMMRATKDGIEDHIFLETADSLYREKLRNNGIVMIPKLIQDVRNNLLISPFIEQTCCENNIEVSVSKEVNSDSICIIKVDKYYNSLNLSKTPPSVDCLILQHCTLQNFYFHIIELKSVDKSPRLDINIVIEKFRTTITDFISVRFLEPIGKYDSVKLKLILVSKVGNTGSDTMLRKILRENSFSYKGLKSIIDLKYSTYTIESC